MNTKLPVIDISPLLEGTDEKGRGAVAREIADACKDTGFFYAARHGISRALMDRLEQQAREFFALPEKVKMKIAMQHGGRAWRGYFPVGGELTSGKPDLKEGLYFGSELGAEHPRVRRGTPLHGANLFPTEIPALKAAVLEYINASTRVAHALMEGIALSLSLDKAYFHRTYTADPTILFRIFHYPDSATDEDAWGVGEHTDYGLLTLLAQDSSGGLEVKSRQGWIAAPPIEGTLVCNIGDMLDRLTGGEYRSTPHRARNRSGRGRLSFPFFFDPDFDASIVPLPGYANAQADDRDARWDKQSVHEFSGTYGDYLLAKVSKVFPELKRTQLSSAGNPADPGGVG